MAQRVVSRRKLLQGGAALAALGLVQTRLTALAAPARTRDVYPGWSPQAAVSTLSFPTRPGEEVLPWLDQPDANPVPEIVGTLLKWEELDSWKLANDEFFTVKHYNLPDIDPPGLEPGSDRPR